MCRHVWPDREVFLSDPELNISGYQVNYAAPRAGLFLFNHDVAGCGTSLAVEAHRFLDLHDGPMFTEHPALGKDDPGYCLRQDDFRQCPKTCECAFVRDILAKVRAWPRRMRAAVGCV